MTIRITFVALLVLTFACRNEPAAPAQPATASQPASTTVAGEPRDLSGQKVDTTIPVPPPPITTCEVSPSFKRNEPIDFKMTLAEAPAELQVSVRIFQGDKEVDVVRQAAEGKTNVTLRLPKLAPGKYRLEGVWGGNVGCEKEIEVRK